MVVARKAPVVVADGYVVADKDANTATGRHILTRGGGAESTTDRGPQRQRPVPGADMNIKEAVAGHPGGRGERGGQPARARRLRAATSFFLRRTLGFS